MRVLSKPQHSSILDLYALEHNFSNNACLKIVLGLFRHSFSELYLDLYPF